jgi:hypothetical protein
MELDEEIIEIIRIFVLSGHPGAEYWTKVLEDIVDIAAKYHIGEYTKYDLIPFGRHATSPKSLHSYKFNEISVLSL